MSAAMLVSCSLIRLLGRSHSQIICSPLTFDLPIMVFKSTASIRFQFLFSFSRGPFTAVAVLSSEGPAPKPCTLPIINTLNLAKCVFGLAGSYFYLLTKHFQGH